MLTIAAPYNTRFLRTIDENKGALVSLFIILVIVLPWSAMIIAPFDPLEQTLVANTSAVQVSSTDTVTRRYCMRNKGVQEGVSFFFGTDNLES